VSTKGYVRFLPLGGWNPQTVLGQRVAVQTANGTAFGVVGAKPPHEMTDEEKKKGVEIEDLWIDFGVTENFNPAEKLKIRVGDPIVPYGEFQKTANPKICIARNWDDRVGCIALIRIFESLKGKTPSCTVYGAFTVQEELGLRGATTVPWSVDPDLAVALDVSLGQDTPAGIEESDAKLGRGVSIVVQDVGMIPNQKFKNALIDLAEKKRISYHLTTVRGGYDTGHIQMYKRGVPCCVMGIPSRYIHGFASMVHYDDVESAVALSLALIEKGNPDFIKRLSSAD